MEPEWAGRNSRNAEMQKILMVKTAKIDKPVQYRPLLADQSCSVELRSVIKLVGSLVRGD